MSVKCGEVFDENSLEVIKVCEKEVECKVCY